MKKQEIAFAKTELGQKLYDIIFGRMSAAEIARRYLGIQREFVLRMRRKYAKMRRMRGK